MSDYARNALLMMTPSYRRASNKHQRSSLGTGPRQSTSNESNIPYDKNNDNANAESASIQEIQKTRKPASISSRIEGLRNGKHHGDKHPLQSVQHHKNFQHQNSLSQLTMSQLSQESHSTRGNHSMHQKRSDIYRNSLLHGSRNDPIAIDDGVNEKRGSNAVSRTNFSKSQSTSKNTAIANENTPLRKRSWMEAIHDVMTTPYRRRKTVESTIPPAKPQKQKRNQTLKEPLSKNQISLYCEESTGETMKAPEVLPNNSSNHQELDKNKLRDEIKEDIFNEIKAHVTEINTMVRADTKAIKDVLKDFKDFIKSEKKEINRLIDNTKDLNIATKKNVEDTLHTTQKAVQDMNGKYSDIHANVDNMVVSSTNLISFVEKTCKEMSTRDQIVEKTVSKISNGEGSSTLISSQTNSSDKSRGKEKGRRIGSSDKVRNVSGKCIKKKTENRRVTRSQKRLLCCEKEMSNKKPKVGDPSSEYRDQGFIDPQDCHQNEKNFPCEIVTVPMTDQSQKTASSDLTENKSPKRLVPRRAEKISTFPLRKEQRSQASKDTSKTRRRVSAPRRAPKSLTQEKNIQLKKKCTSLSQTLRGPEEDERVVQKRVVRCTLSRRRRRIRKPKENVEDKSYSKIIASKFTSFFKSSDDSDPFEFK